jgi:peptidase propeptide and ypeb domain protein
MKKVLGVAVLATVLGVTSLYAAISSKDALSIAEKNFPGSSVKGIDIDVKNGVTFYKIESFKDGVKQEIKIDANSGQIVKLDMEKEKFILPNEAIDFSKLALSIDEAVAKALALEAGWSLDVAELDKKNGLWVYEIELDRGMSEKKVIINAQTGEIIGNYTK